MEYLLISAILAPILYFTLKDDTTPIVKDKEYLYNWLVNEGVLVNNSNLEYTTINEGVPYSLCYSTAYVDSLNMMIRYSCVTSERYTINGCLHLFAENESVFYISAENNGLNRWYEYSFLSSIYKENTSMTYVDNDGDTVDISEYTWFDGEKHHIDYDSMPIKMKEK